LNLDFEETLESIKKIYDLEGGASRKNSFVWGVCKVFQKNLFFSQTLLQHSYENATLIVVCYLWMSEKFLSSPISLYENNPSNPRIQRKSSHEGIFTAIGKKPVFLYIWPLPRCEPNPLHISDKS
jgi:hypothetical protein